MLCYCYVGVIDHGDDGHEDGYNNYDDDDNELTLMIRVCDKHDGDDYDGGIVDGDDDDGGGFGCGVGYSCGRNKGINIIFHHQKSYNEAVHI